MSLTELKEFAKVNIVIGYNRLTGDITVKTPDDVYEYMKAREKLFKTGETLMKSKDCVFITTADCREDKETGDLIITISSKSKAGFDICCYYTNITIDYDAVIGGTVYKYIGIEGKLHKGVHIVYDFSAFKGSLMCVGLIYYTKEICIKSVNVKNKEMFSKASHIECLFKFNNFSVHSEFKADLTDLIFPEKFTTRHLIKDIQGDLKLPEAFYRNGKHERLFASDTRDCIITREEFLKGFHSNPSAFKDSNFRIERLYCKDFVGVSSEITKEFSRCTIKADMLIWDKTIQDIKKFSGLIITKQIGISKDLRELLSEEIIKYLLIITNYYTRDNNEIENNFNNLDRKVYKKIYYFLNCEFSELEDDLQDLLKSAIKNTDYNFQKQRDALHTISTTFGKISTIWECNQSQDDCDIFSIRTDLDKAEAELFALLLANHQMIQSGITSVKNFEIRSGLE